MNIDVTLEQAEAGDNCALCEMPIPEGVVAVMHATSLEPDECHVICVRCARAVGVAAELRSR